MKEFYYLHTSLYCISHADILLDHALCIYVVVFSIASLLTKYCKECTKLQISFFIVAIAIKVFKMVPRKALKDSISF